MGIIVFILLMVAGVCVYDFIDSRNWQSATSNSRNVVIFENRNKKYGAYHLRTDYNDSFGVILGIFVFSFFVISIVNATVRTAPEKVILPKIDTIVMNIAAPPVEVIETIKTPYKISSGRQGGGSAPSNDPVIKAPMEQMQKPSQLAQTSVVAESGESNKNNGKNPDNKPSSISKGVNPFNPGGTTKGTKCTLGPDGIGIGPGTETDGPQGIAKNTTRKKLTSLSADDIQSNTACHIRLKVYINAEGRVINAKNEAKQTTTSDAVLIAKVIALVKEQIRYEKKFGVSQEIAYLPINVSAR